jgi:NAD(P)-dependent dehydrogenase (short-subunit alcohol dehydrogenase family)
VALALDTWGRLDIVVNNAGFGRPRMVFNLGDDEWDDVIRVHLRGTFVVSRPACVHWRARAKEHGSTYGRLINTATGLLVYGGAGQSNYVAAKAGINAFTEAVATEMAPYGVTANSIMPGANTRLAQIGWRTSRAIEAEGDTEQAQAMRDPVHVAELGCFLASPEAAGISGQTFQVHGGTIEHVQTWKVVNTWHRDDRGFTAGELAGRLPLDAGPKAADRPPPEWTAARKH